VSRTLTERQPNLLVASRLALEPPGRCRYIDVGPREGSSSTCWDILLVCTAGCNRPLTQRNMAKTSILSISVKEVNPSLVQGRLPRSIANGHPLRKPAPLFWLDMNRWSRLAHPGRVQIRIKSPMAVLSRSNQEIPVGWKHCRRGTAVLCPSSLWTDVILSTKMLSVKLHCSIRQGSCADNTSSSAYCRRIPLPQPFNDASLLTTFQECAGSPLRVCLTRQSHIRWTAWARANAAGF